MLVVDEASRALIDNVVNEDDILQENVTSEISPQRQLSHYTDTHGKRLNSWKTSDRQTRVWMPSISSHPSHMS